MQDVRCDLSLPWPLPFHDWSSSVAGDGRCRADPQGGPRRAWGQSVCTLGTALQTRRHWHLCFCWCVKLNWPYMLFGWQRIIIHNKHFITQSISANCSKSLISYVRHAIILIFLTSMWEFDKSAGDLAFAAKYVWLGYSPWGSCSRAHPHPDSSLKVTSFPTKDLSRACIWPGA